MLSRKGYATAPSVTPPTDYPTRLRANLANVGDNLRTRIPNATNRLRHLITVPDGKDKKAHAEHVRGDCHEVIEVHVDTYPSQSEPLHNIAIGNGGNRDQPREKCRTIRRDE